MSVIILEDALTVTELDDMIDMFETIPDMACMPENVEKMLSSLCAAYEIAQADDVYAKGDPLPESMGASADLLHEVRDMRLLLDKLASAVKSRESEIQEHIIQNLSSGDDTGAAGKKYRVQIKTSDKPRPDDWGKIHQWIKDNNRFDLLQKRLSDKAVMEVLEDGNIPGMDIMVSKSISLTKV